MTALILDTETTGINEPEVVQLAHTQPMNSPFDIPLLTLKEWRPNKPISLGALATHHILDEELAGFEPWPGSWSPAPGVAYLVGHNIDFDWKAIGSPDVKRICTLALSRAHFPDIDSHSLGALTYYLSADRREARDLLRHAHNAETDVHLCYQLLHALINATGAKTWDELYAASEKARIPQRMPLGKYGPANGKPGILISEVRRTDPSYVSWCLRQDFDPYLLKALRGQSA